MKIGERIRQLRSQKGLTLAEASAMIGMTPAGLSLIELGKRRITTEQLERLAAALEVSPADFFATDVDVASSPSKEAPTDG